MIDAPIQDFTKPLWDRIGGFLAARGISAETVTLSGLVLAAIGAVLIAFGMTWTALPLIVLARAIDAVDGAVARRRGADDFGGFTDIFADFIYYGVVTAAFVWQDPAINGAAGAFLLFSFHVNGASFLGVAVLVAKNPGIDVTVRRHKSFHYSRGFMEATETLAFLIIICLWPSIFAVAAWIFGALCFATAFIRFFSMRKLFAAHKASAEASAPASASSSS